MKKHKHTSYENRLESLESEVRKLRDLLKKKHEETIKVYSLNGEACVGMKDPRWHRLVCLYEGKNCIGTPTDHWHSSWILSQEGVTLDAMLNKDWKGWHGQYAPSELRYDELPKEILALHVKTMKEYLRDKFTVYLPCHIFNDFTGELYRP